MNGGATAVWGALRLEGRGEAGWHLRRIHPMAACEIFAGLRQPGGVQGLVLEVPIEAVAPDVNLPQSRGFSLEAQLLGSSHSGHVRFALALADPAYESVFATLCDHVAEAAASAPTARLGLREWVRQLHVWQEFMARHGPGGLSHEAILGLIGELIILKDRLAPHLGTAAAVAAWAGPSGEPNDFELSGGYLEVKATSRQAPDTLQVSNLDQLDDRRGVIMLASVRLRPDPGGMTLPGLVSELRRLTSVERGRTLTDLNARLLAPGYVDVHADLYPSTWIADRIDFYAVRDDFPRLTPLDVRPGVRSCSYSIAIADCAPFLATGTDLEVVMGRRAND
ncbi:MAG: PD-(D/E)XK motif protein [Mesorhizobium sp.]|uniref:PD-(D/E)XK motif protein n=1 Tax=Mesorhizobium sp. TaxID=1871066 RepID=UPI0011F91E96|nr:PD-(D/E)XK motif protein [Mesorhizobium sp.]TIP24252.1 MAG: PD-(D/E)XK motif protein [Mesorhizobium sp.]